MLTAEQMEHFDVFGFLCLRQAFCREEMAQFTRAADEVFAAARGGGPDDGEKCETCGKGHSTKGDPMLLCDGCDKGWHRRCLGVASVPKGDWHCRACADLGGDGGFVGFGLLVVGLGGE